MEKLPNCVFCGRFVGWRKPFVSWVPYGSCLDMEPPDDEYAHRACWDANNDMHSLIRRTSWLKPILHGGSYAE